MQIPADHFLLWAKKLKKTAKQSVPLPAFAGQLARELAPLNALKILFAKLFLLVAVSGCVNTSTLPSQNINTLFSEDNSKPSQQDTAGLEAKLTAAEPLNGTNTTSADKPAADANPTPTSGEEAKEQSVETALVKPKEEQTTPAQSAAQSVAEPVQTQKTESKPKAPNPKPETATPANQETQTAAAAPSTEEKTQTAEQETAQKSGGFFASLFSRSNNRTTSRPRVNVEPGENSRAATVQRVRRPAASSDEPVVRVSKRASKRNTNRGDLPGVRLRKLFGLDTEDHDELDEPYQVASVTNLARRGTHGLLLQRPDVRVGCFPPKLIRILKSVERRFGRTPVVTSGYRTRAHNRRIRGARNSMHVFCKAADIQVKGISKWRLAKYLRSLPGRGGVGTYCHTKSVHIDIAGKRDWNIRCRRKRKRR